MRRRARIWLDLLKDALGLGVGRPTLTLTEEHVGGTIESVVIFDTETGRVIEEGFRLSPVDPSYVLAGNGQGQPVQAIIIP